MRIVFDDEAIDDIQSIRTWIARDSPLVAADLIGRIFDKIESLRAPELTYMGRPGLDHGTHELIEYPYIIVYEVHQARGEIVVLAVVHGAQDRKPKT
jgi:plasmid stabilization system protein ParE